MKQDQILELNFIKKT